MHENIREIDRLVTEVFEWDDKLGILVKKLEHIYGDRVKDVLETRHQEVKDYMHLLDREPSRSAEVPYNIKEIIEYQDTLLKLRDLRQKLGEIRCR